jgi:hypothetical protein
MLKVPLSVVAVPDCLPRITTDTPCIRFPSSSCTMPLMVADCDKLHSDTINQGKIIIRRKNFIIIKLPEINYKSPNRFYIKAVK